MDVQLMALWEGYHIYWLLYCITISVVRQSSVVRAVNTKCDCVVFEETFGKEFGVFTSPNWPVPYVDNINCLLYSFLAERDQIVEITFDEFDVQKTSLDCEYGDFIKLFLHLDEPGVNEKTSWNSILCGKIADIEQTHYSSHSNLVFEFRSDWRNGNNTGFRGTYRFLNKQMFHTDGELIPKSKCDYKFESTATINGTARSRGRFYSPQYPSTYPKNIECSYIFVGQSNERVKLTLESIRLLKTDLSCINSPDLILIHDGNDTSAPVIGQLCNINSYVELVSTGPVLYVQFLSRSHTPGQGFKGKFTFDTIGNSANTVVVDIPSTGKSAAPVVQSITDPNVALCCIAIAFNY
ncbi:unnamed protein product [Medioppia subpectinata]|uniref:CUB domain-containing protein n=1 Tax=Medioppia subpectinata TaxID=1979941 RepID=A0A7R9KWW7_9ACAR|nr:unnamed protein product [Medioppia subpectinata]CAG2110268.1 unnamed protein product [Medioppia subpectinata]